MIGPRAALSVLFRARRELFLIAVWLEIRAGPVRFPGLARSLFRALSARCSLTLRTALRSGF